MYVLLGTYVRTIEFEISPPTAACLSHNLDSGVFKQLGCNSDQTKIYIYIYISTHIPTVYSIMDELTYQLFGVRLSLSARDAVMNAQPPRKMVIRRIISTSTSRSDNSVDLQKFPLLLDSSSFDDDETLETMSMSDDASCYSSTSSTDLNHSNDTRSRSALRVVTFANPLVTQVHFRPTTTISEKRDLFYSDVDYRLFRRNYHFQRDTLVGFKEKVVTDVWEIPPVDCPEDLYYSNSDLQRYVLQCSCLCTTIKC
jgi:hypothetical protein